MNVPLPLALLIAWDVPTRGLAAFLRPKSPLVRVL
jgi:hypothetical protein